MKQYILAVLTLVLISGILFPSNHTKADDNQTTSKTRNTYINQVGDHHIMIISTAGNSTTNATRNDDSLYYDDGNCSIQLKDEILTVNGERYDVPNKSDSICIEDDHVKINGKTVYSNS